MKRDISVEYYSFIYCMALRALNRCHFPRTSLLLLWPPFCGGGRECKFEAVSKIRDKEKELGNYGQRSDWRKDGARHLRGAAYMYVSLSVSVSYLVRSKNFDYLHQLTFISLSSLFKYLFFIIIYWGDWKFEFDQF